jgi:hypothetical protein
MTGSYVVIQITKIGKKIDALQVENTNFDSLNKWFEDLRGHIRRLHITPDTSINMDETGVALGVCTNTRVIGTASTGSSFLTLSGSVMLSSLSPSSSSSQLSYSLIVSLSESLSQYSSTSVESESATASMVGQSSDSAWTFLLAAWISLSVAS